MKIRKRRFIPTTIPNNSVYRLLGSAYEKTSNGSWIKITRRSKPPLTGMGLAWISPAAAKQYGILSHLHFLPYLSDRQYHSFHKHLCTAETQNADTASLAMPLNPFVRNDTAMHIKHSCTFDLDIYVRVKVHYHGRRQLCLTIRAFIQHADISSNAWDMAIYVQMNFT